MKLKAFIEQDVRPTGTGDGREHTFVLTPNTDIEETEGDYGKYFIAEVAYLGKNGYETRKVSISIPLWITLRDKHGIAKITGAVVVTVRRDSTRPRDDQYIVSSRLEGGSASPTAPLVPL